VALAAGLPPPLIAAMPARDFAALETALERRWTLRDEIAATTAELLHALVLVQLARAGVKRDRLGPPLRVPRPSKTTATGKRVASGHELAAALGARSAR
jgi:hypothetical protein